MVVDAGIFFQMCRIFFLFLFFYLICLIKITNNKKRLEWQNKEPNDKIQNDLIEICLTCFLKNNNHTNKNRSASGSTALAAFSKIM